MDINKQKKEKKYKVKKDDLLDKDYWNDLNIKDIDNIINFDLINTMYNNLTNDIDANNHKIKNKSKHKIKKKENKVKNDEIKNNEAIIENNRDEYDSDYLEKKFVKNKKLIDIKKDILQNNKSNTNEENNKIETINPIIKNEVIWYSNELDSEELEKKFKDKFKNKLTHKDKNLFLHSFTNNKEPEEFEKKEENEYVEERFVSNPNKPLIKTQYDKKCIYECKKIDNNIFEWDINCDPNCDLNYDLNYSGHKIFNGNYRFSHLWNMFFMSDSKKIYPELVEIYLNNVFVKKVYGDIINNIINDDEKQNMYSIADSTYPLHSDLKIKIIIKDTKLIDNIYFNVFLEKIEKNDINEYLNKNIYIEHTIKTHELLYHGFETNICVNDNVNYGNYNDIWIICENIIDNIETISITNSDTIIMQNIPIQIICNNSNSFRYCLTVKEQSIFGIKINSENGLEIKLKKKSNSKIKIYGTKIFKLNNDLKKNIIFFKD